MLYFEPIILVFWRFFLVRVYMYYLVIPAKVWYNGQPHSEYSSGNRLDGGIHDEVWDLVDTLLDLTPHPHMMYHVT